MPLIKSPSKKAFKENMESEMDSGKPKDQSLAIAYDVKRRNKRKKMAYGGSADEGPSEKANQTGVHKIVPNYDREHKEFKHGQSEARYDDKKAKHMEVLNELRAMPKPNLPMYDGGMVNINDSHQIARNAAKKALHEDQWTDQPTVSQAQKPSITPLSRPKFVNGAFKVRDRADVDKEEMMMSKLGPNDGPQRQPDEEYNEEESKRQGPQVPDMSKEHNNSRKPYAEGGMINRKVSMPSAEDDRVEHPAGLEEDDDQMRPSEEDYMSGHNHMLAEGGMIGMDEEHMDREDSIAAAIMARKERQSRLDSDSDDDRMVMMADGGIIDSIKSGMPGIFGDSDKPKTGAPKLDPDKAKAMSDYFNKAKGGMVGYAEGGEVDLSESSMEQPNRYYPRNEDEILKENYADEAQNLKQPMESNEHSDSIDSDEHDMIARIRSKMNMHRQFKVK